MKIAPELSYVEQKLNRLGTIRNYFAHVGQPFIEGTDPDGVSRFPDPRNFAKSVNFETLHQEFLDMEVIVLKALIASFEAKGGKFAV